MVMLLRTVKKHLEGSPHADMNYKGKKNANHSRKERKMLSLFIYLSHPYPNQLGHPEAGSAPVFAAALATLRRTSRHFSSKHLWASKHPAFILCIFYVVW